MAPGAASTSVSYQRSRSLTRHARLYAGHPRLKSPSPIKDVDGRNKSGHDVDRVSITTTVGISRGGVALAPRVDLIAGLPRVSPGGHVSESRERATRPETGGGRGSCGAAGW